MQLWPSVSVLCYSVILRGLIIEEGRLIMIVTQLDIFLMQFGVFVTNSNSLVMAISIFHPAELIAKLHSLHQRIESILEKLRMMGVGVVGSLECRYTLRVYFSPNPH
jgi:hypothetical protein